jgi:hypothetical protein
LKLGIDLDNTIALYDYVFCKYAQKFFGLAECLTKREVANYFINSNRETDWTWLQGEVYGKYMGEAMVAPGFIEAIKSDVIQSFRIEVVSHRTKFPSSGASYDMHSIAYNWLEDNVFKHLHDQSKITVNFFETLPSKINFIAESSFTIFIDDLSHVLNDEKFPVKTRGIQFTNGASSEKNSNRWLTMKSWGELTSLISDMNNEKA